MFDHSMEDFQVGWVCALPKELTAARAMLDEEYESLPTRVPQDGNSYVTGRIHGHNVVIACLPAGVYGTNSAAVVATNMMRTFTSLRVYLVVGIGGGIPDLERGIDIRLGDVVVSQPDQTHGGVVQYDLRKNLGAGVFERKGTLNQPPSVLLSAVARLRSNHQMGKNQILENIVNVQERFPQLVKAGFKHPGSVQDVLYCSKSGDHDATETGAQCDHGKIRRDVRMDQCPEVYYGTIASGNELLKNASERDRLGRELGAKCVEMEAAGLVNDLPCIVIRGICDYADQNKNDVWQEYAAVAASSYARELLSLLPPAEMQRTVAQITATPRIPQRFPFPRNDDVVIRKTIFSKLEMLLLTRSLSPSAVLWGLGGAGDRKTQIALEFAYRRHTEKQYRIFWIHASNYDRFLQGYRQIAVDAGISSTAQGPELLAAVRTWLEDQDEWLLILDNADDLSLFGLHSPGTATDQCTNLMPFIPCGSHGSILWTTRDERAVGHVVGMSRGINVRDMTNDEAKELLIGLSGQPETVDNATFVSGILEHLERLPLAVSQAAAYVRERNMSYFRYLDRLSKENKRWRVLVEDGPKRYRPDGVPHNVMQTWQITVSYLEHAFPLAHWILMVIVHFHNQNIPWSLIRAVGLHKLQEERESRGQWQLVDRQSDRSRSSDSDDSDAEEDEVRSALHRLAQFSLVRTRSDRNQEMQSYNIHKLVQDATRRSLGQSSRGNPQPQTSTLAETALHILNQVFPSGLFGTWDDCAKLLSHVLTISRWPELAGFSFTKCDLLDRAAKYLWKQGLWDEVARIKFEVLELRKQALGEKHPHTITTMDDCASVYYKQGYFKRAEEIELRVLELQKEVRGDKHPNTITSMAHLALTYSRQKRITESQEIYIEVLALRKEVLGENHPDTIKSMSDLGTAYFDQGLITEAEDLYRQVLQLRYKILPENHPNTITSMGQLARIHYRQRRFDEAEKIFLDVLRLRKEILGVRHPDTLSSMGDVATVYFAQGRISEAVPLQVEVVELYKEILGEKHPNTIQRMDNLAKIYYENGRRDEAEVLYQKLIELQTEVLGEDHVETVGTREVLDTYSQHD